MKISKSNIKRFLNDYADKAVELKMPDHMWELLMDDHRGVCWYGVEYIIPENCSMWNDDELMIAEHLFDNYPI